MTNRPTVNFNAAGEEAQRIFNKERANPAEGLVQKRNCASCVKFDTCLIWRLHADTCTTINTQLDKGNSDNKLNPHLIATVCPHYLQIGETFGR